MQHNAPAWLAEEAGDCAYELPDGAVNVDRFGAICTVLCEAAYSPGPCRNYVLKHARALSPLHRRKIERLVKRGRSPGNVEMAIAAKALAEVPAVDLLTIGLLWELHQ